MNIERWKLSLVKRRSAIAIVFAAGSLALGFAGCGSSGKGHGTTAGSAGGAAAIAVNGVAITKAEIDRWIPIEAVIRVEAFPKAPAPAGLVPDPPGFEKCASFALTSQGPRLLALTSAPRGRPAAVRACEKDYQTIRRHVMALLTSFQWVRQEAHERGLMVSSGEIQRAFSRVAHEQYGGEAGMAKYLKYSGETVGDERMLLEVNVLAEKFEKYAVKTFGARGMVAFFRSFATRWAAKTSCEPEYVFANCREYKGSEQPEAAA